MFYQIKIKFWFFNKSIGFFFQISNFSDSIDQFDWSEALLNFVELQN